MSGRPTCRHQVPIGGGRFGFCGETATDLRHVPGFDPSPLCREHVEHALAYSGVTQWFSDIEEPARR